MTDRVVRVPGGETSDFGDSAQRTCDENAREAVTLEEARSLGLGVDEDLALLEQRIELPLRWGPRARSSNDGGAPGLSPEPLDEVVTAVNFTAELADIYRVSYHPNTSAPCPDTLAYRVKVDLTTADRRLDGVFYARLDPIEPGRLCASALPDLRNFRGTYGVRLDRSRPYRGVLSADFCLDEEGGSGAIQSLVQYTDSGALEEGAGAYWSAAEDDTGPCCLPPLVEPGPGIIALNDYTASAVIPTSNVRVRVRAVEGADVQLRVDSNATELELNEQGEADLGDLPDGTRVELAITNPDEGGLAQANLLVDNCWLAGSTCTDPGCVAQVDYTVWFSRCFD